MILTKTDMLAVPHLDAPGFDGLRNFKATGVSTNSRTIRAGDVFVAIRGDQFDAHNFISTAVESGAAAIVAERKWAEANPAMLVSIHVPRLIVENTVHALGSLALAYRRKFRIPVIAVAGSNGKTTTKEMITSVLSTKYRVLSTEGNLNNHIGVPQTLFRLERKHNVAVVEVGTNHPGEIDYLCSIVEPTHGLITNIGLEHLEFFGTREGAAKAEIELFAWLTSHRGMCFINADEKALSSHGRKVKRKITYGFDARSAGIKGSLVSFDQEALPLIRVKIGTRKAFEMQVGAPGEHNAQNALAAIAVGTAMKIPAGAIQQALNTFQPAAKRMQVQHIADVTILNDTYNANPDSTLAALAVMREMRSTGKRIAVLSDMLELGNQAQALHAQIGESVKRYGIDLLLTYGALSRYTHNSADAPAKMHFESKAALIENLLNSLGPGDIVLVKGSRGMKMEEVVTAAVERLSHKAGA